jgi:glycerol-3-phosphate O-acyltransferase
MNSYLIPFLIKNSGTFIFGNKRYAQSKLYKAIFNEYVQRLLINGNNL